MTTRDYKSSRRALSSAKATMIMLGIAVAVLGLLAAIGQTDWFQVRPATGTAVAMSYAAAPAKADQAAPVQKVRE